MFMIICRVYGEMEKGHRMLSVPTARVWNLLRACQKVADDMGLGSGDLGLSSGVPR